MRSLISLVSLSFATAFLGCGQPPAAVPPTMPSTAPQAEKTKIAIPLPLFYYESTNAEGADYGPEDEIAVSLVPYGEDDSSSPWRISCRHRATMRLCQDSAGRQRTKCVYSPATEIRQITFDFVTNTVIVEAVRIPGWDCDSACRGRK